MTGQPLAPPLVPAPTQPLPPGLRALVAQRCDQPFAWGVRDCAMWAFDAVRHLTGQDPAPDLRGRYRTAMQALRLLKAQGGWEGVAARFGAQVPLHQAHAGCVVLLAPGVCGGALAGAGGLGMLWHGAVLAQGAHGLVAVSVRHALRAWRPA